jgi:endonuclease III related protein
MPSAFMSVYRRLRLAYGHSGWWPGRTRFEVCVGAILTQNTSWTNAARAIASLRARGLLSWAALRRARRSTLEAAIRSSGTFRLKARRLSAFVDFLGREYGGRVAAMARDEPLALRLKLLGVCGIGPETADVIALYAAGRPLFVIDAYTRRVFGRLGLVDPGAPYETVQAAFTRALPRDAALFADYHAQIVRLAKEACRKQPRCRACPLHSLCPKRGVPEA